MKLSDIYPSGIWAIDFEFHPLQGVEGNPIIPVCMVAHNISTNQTLRIWQDELGGVKKAPFPTDSSSLILAYYASAEIGCFIALGWQIPVNVLDLYTEFRCCTNGIPPKHGNGLLGAMIHFGIPCIHSDEKSAMRDLILSRGPWSKTERNDILDYCQSDVMALEKLLAVMEPHIDMPRALFRGEYMAAAAKMESTGIRLDLTILEKIKDRWESIQDELIASFDKNFNVYEGRTFKTVRWENYLANAGIPWLRLPSGALDMSDDAFREMSRSYPQIAPIQELRYSLSKMRLATLTVGEDGRNRYMLSAFRATTGRNQPSNSKSIFGPATWMRGLIKPAKGFGIAYVDWSQQEFGIAAALSKDLNMQKAYASGDPYLSFAKQSGAVPPYATKESHNAQREQFKSCVLATQYGMGPESLALRINQPVARARQLLDLHRTTYRTFWRWSDCCLDEAILGGALWTNFGWKIQVNDKPNERSLRNFPMQAHGAEMLRIACILLNRAGIKICAPIHDAILIEAPIDELDFVIEQTQQLMREASRIVLWGFELESDVKVVKYPQRFMDPRGLVMWNTVMELIGEPKHE